MNSNSFFVHVVVSQRLVNGERSARSHSKERNSPYSKGISARSETPYSIYVASHMPIFDPLEGGTAEASGMIGVCLTIVLTVALCPPNLDKQGQSGIRSSLLYF